MDRDSGIRRSRASQIKGRRVQARNERAGEERGVDRGPDYKLTHKGPPVINTRRGRAGQIA